MSAPVLSPLSVNAIRFPSEDGRAGCALAAGADAPQLLGGLIKEEGGVVGHGCSFARPFIPWLGPKGKPSAPLYDAFLPRVFKEMGPEPSRDAVRPITLRGNNAERSARASLVSTDRTICRRRP